MQATSRVIVDKRSVGLDYVTDCLVIREPDSPPRTLPLSRIRQVVCLHTVDLDTRLIAQLLRRGIDLIVLNQRHAELSFSFHADHALSSQRRIMQYEWQLEESHRLLMAKRLIRHKLHVQERTLRRLGAEKTESIVLRLRQARQSIEDAVDESMLRGVEGAAQRAAFDWWRLRVPAGLGFERRQRRPPPDPVNALLSLTYVLVHEDATRQAKLHGLDPYLGCYHRPASGRMSLACDIMEPIRPKVEAWVFEAFRNGVFDARFFTKPVAGKGCFLGKEGRKVYYRAWEEPQRQWRRHLGRICMSFARTVSDDMARGN